MRSANVLSKNHSGCEGGEKKPRPCFKIQKYGSKIPEIIPVIVAILHYKTGFFERITLSLRIPELFEKPFHNNHHADYDENSPE